MKGVAAVHGVDVRAVESAADLGMQTYAGRRRMLGKTAARCQKAWQRNRRVRKLGQRRARVRVFSTAVKPSLAYGVSAIGMAPTSLRKLRTAYAGHQGRSAEMCTTT